MLVIAVPENIVPNPVTGNPSSILGTTTSFGPVYPASVIFVPSLVHVQLAASAGFCHAELSSASWAGVSPPPAVEGLFRLAENAGIPDKINRKATSTMFMACFLPSNTLSGRARTWC
jgi:hypothetical protein